jgi:S1-C subfamily serine protease
LAYKPLNTDSLFAFGSLFLGGGLFATSLGGKMKLSESYRNIRQSIVAITSKYTKLKVGETPSEVPFILGTGFIVDDGLIVTNEHVSKEINSLPKPPDAPAEEWPALCYMFIEINQNDLAMVPLEILGKYTIQSYDPEGKWYGDIVPDIGFIRVKAKGLPVLELNSDWEILKEGMELATAGFPLGRETLYAPGYLHHIGPTLQTGILSALLPFPRSRPHAFIMNILSLDGQSGSPIFHPNTGEVLGILYGGLENKKNMNYKNNYLEYSQPTSLSYCLPSGLIEVGVKTAQKEPNYLLPKDTPTLKEIINTSQNKKK